MLPQVGIWILQSKTITSLFSVIDAYYCIYLVLNNFTVLLIQSGNSNPFYSLDMAILFVTYVLTQYYYGFRFGLVDCFSVILLFYILYFLEPIL